jgi:2-C-methyl-D-erythritol 4-phosphate cytidylyltransferase/2-C-methyl-D-erythritol 2,4-cyclodiphosphate synthase
MLRAAILLAAGSATRMGQSTDDKILLELAGKPVFSHVLKAFRHSNAVDGLVVVCKGDHQRKALKELISKHKVSLPILFTNGGSTRIESVRNGLMLIPSETRWVLIHDCARPVIAPQAIRDVMDKLVQSGTAVSLARKVTDTLRSFESDPSLQPALGQSLERHKLWAMETPQGFPRDQLDALHAAIPDNATDDISAFEHANIPVALVESVRPNPKITLPSDLPLIENLLAKQTMQHNSLPRLRIGHGYDIHRLVKGLPLTLGGVSIPSDFGLEGHSDADVLAHAIADAILGALGLPDIGHFFPNTDSSIKGISSIKIIQRCVSEAEKRGYVILNCDTSIIVEFPRLSPFIEKMKGVLSEALHVQKSDVGIKSTTQEGIGSLGKGHGIAAQAVVLLHQP